MNPFSSENGLFCTLKSLPTCKEVTDSFLHLNIFSKKKYIIFYNEKNLGSHSGRWLLLKGKFTMTGTIIMAITNVDDSSPTLVKSSLFSYNLSLTYKANESSLP